MKEQRIFTMSFSVVYPLYLQKVERKGRTKEELDEVLRWLSGFSQEELEAHIKDQTSFEDLFAAAPALNPARSQIKGMICGIRLEEMEDGLMKEIRYMDKVVDELAKGKAIQKILRTQLGQVQP